MKRIYSRRTRQVVQVIGLMVYGYVSVGCTLIPKGTPSISHKPRTTPVERAQIHRITPMKFQQTRPASIERDEDPKVRWLSPLELRPKQGAAKNVYILQPKR